MAANVMGHYPDQNDLAEFGREAIMSEYQYYEFQKVDGCLSEMEMDELRGYSTRVRITPSRFILEHSFSPRFH